MSTAKKRGLGRGLEALLGPKAAAEAPQIVEALLAGAFGASSLATLMR